MVFSTVRCKPLNELKDETDKHWMMENLGHVTDSHRICVALTRARYGLVIIGEFPLCTTYSRYIHATIALQFTNHCLMAGNQALLSKDPLWKELVDHCKDRQYMVYRNESRKFPPQGRMNQVRAAQQRKGTRLRVPTPIAHTYKDMFKSVKTRGTSSEDEKEIDEVVKYYNELMKIVKFLAQEQEHLSSLTVTIE